MGHCLSQVCGRVILGCAVMEWIPVLWREKARGQELDLEKTRAKFGKRNLKMM